MRGEATAQPSAAMRKQNSERNSDALSSSARDRSLVGDRPGIAQHHQSAAVAVGEVEQARIRVLEDFARVDLRGRCRPGAPERGDRK